MAVIVTLIFARFPEPGRVKTRMTPPLSPAQAARVHRASLTAVCENVSRIAGLEPTLVVTPDDRANELRALLDDRIAGCQPQGDGDLDARLIRATDRAFESGAQSVLLLGADSPTLPLDYLREAAARLSGSGPDAAASLSKGAPDVPARLSEDGRESAVRLVESGPDAVLGPCDDGGYYLLGIRSTCNEWRAMFDRIDWGSSRVSAQTRDRAAARGIDLTELPPWYDLDRYEDLVRAEVELGSMPRPLRPALAGLHRVIRACVTKGASRNVGHSGPPLCQGTHPAEGGWATNGSANSSEQE